MIDRGSFNFNKTSLRSTMVITSFIFEIQLPILWQYFLCGSNTYVCHTWISCHPCAGLMSPCLDTLLHSMSSSSLLRTFCDLFVASFLLCLDYFGALVVLIAIIIIHEPDIPFVISCLLFHPTFLAFFWNENSCWGKEKKNHTYYLFIFFVECIFTPRLEIFTHPRLDPFSYWKKWRWKCAEMTQLWTL